MRRCFLCGDDPYTGHNYDHRKAWLEQRLAFVAGQFGIDVLGFAILSNHFHLVLRNRPDLVATWSDSEVARRWFALCPLRKTRDGEPAATMLYDNLDDGIQNPTPAQGDLDGDGDGDIDVQDLDLMFAQFGLELDLAS